MPASYRTHGRDEESTMVLQFMRILQRTERLTKVTGAPRDRPTEERSTDQVWLHCVW